MAGFMPPASPPLVSTAMLEGPVAEGAVAVSVMKQVNGPGPVRSTHPTATTFGTSRTFSSAGGRLRAGAGATPQLAKGRGSGPFRRGAVIAPMQAAGTSHEYQRGQQAAEPRHGQPARQRRTAKGCEYPPINRHARTGRREKCAGPPPIGGPVGTGVPGRSPLRWRSSWWRPWRRQVSGGEVR